MSVHKIVQIGDDVLREKARPLKISNIKTTLIQGLISTMFDILSKRKEGVALAAPQIGQSLQLFIISEKAYKNENKKIAATVFINPQIVKTSKKNSLLEEGCLSVDGKIGKVERASQVTVRAYNEKGKKFEQGCSGLIAQIIQHEMDHLNGVLFTDRTKDLRDFEI